MLMALCMWSCCFVAPELSIDCTGDEERVYLFTPWVGGAWGEVFKEWTSGTGVNDLELGYLGMIRVGLDMLNRVKDPVSVMVILQACFGLLSMSSFQRWGFDLWYEAVQTGDPLTYWTVKVFAHFFVPDGVYAQSQTPFDASNPLYEVKYNGKLILSTCITESAGRFCADFDRAARKRAGWDVKNRIKQRERNAKAALLRQIRKEDALRAQQNAQDPPA